jgi:hypothetical protein
MTHADLINLWPSLSAFAEDLGVQYVTAKAMRRRVSVPAGYWLRMIECAETRGIEGVTLDVLARAAAHDEVGPPAEGEANPEAAQ